MPQNLVAASLILVILAVFVLGVFVLADVRDRAKSPPLPKRVLDRYDDAGRRIDL